MTADLAAAARFEVQLRADKYPALVASGKLSADEATIDYQAWHLVAEFIATGNFQTIDAGGIDGQTVVDWALAEDAVTKALAKVQDTAANAKEDKRPALWARSAALTAIARKVSLRRQSVEAINRHFREQRQAA